MDWEKAGQVYPSSSTPSFMRNKEPSSTWTQTFQMLPLIVPSDNTDTSTVPGHLPEVFHPNESSEPSGVVDNDKLDWKSTASATAKLLLRWARDSADAFGPLKSVTGSLCFILDNYQVCPLCAMLSTILTTPLANKSKQAGNRIIGLPD